MAYEFRATARYLAKAAAERRLVEYGELTKALGGVPMGWGDTLNDMVHRLYKHGLPLLPVIVVSKGSDLPSIDAKIYGRLGIDSPEAVRAEQQRCFDHHWSSSAPMR